MSQENILVQWLEEDDVEEHSIQSDENNETVIFEDITHIPVVIPGGVESEISLVEQDQHKMSSEEDHTEEGNSENILKNIDSNGDNQSEVNSNNVRTRILTRKRKRNVEQWKCSIRKRRCQAGESYVSKRGKFVPEKSVKNKKDCLHSCKYKCSQLINEDERQQVFNSFYKLDQNQKLHFLLRTTERHLKSRVYPKKDLSRRAYTFRYFFDIVSDRFQVCKTFYLGTLNISQKPIYNAHKGKNPVSNTPQNTQRGSGKGRRLSDRCKQKVIDHINRFPKIPSHYCRADTNKEYLDANLNIRKMHQLYVEECNEKLVEPVKESMYRNIFCNLFNLDFHKPKKDLCITCEEIHLLQIENKEVSLEKGEKFNKHKEMKQRMKEEKNRDKQSGIPIVCFDLQNVITLPITNIGNFFYLQKLTCFNLTGHYSKTKHVYNAIWTEYIGGRTANDIASALIQILERVLMDDHAITEIITWSDSCVPQNRNSFMSYAILTFLKTHPNIQSIIMKYSIAGHSAIQEVDNAHSQLEKKLRSNDIFSPIGLIRVLKTVNPKFQFIQMRNQYFSDFSSCSKNFNYKQIPYTKVVELKYTQNLSVVQYKTDYDTAEYATVSIKTQKPKLRRAANLDELFPKPKPKKSPQPLSAEKSSALRTMMAMMPAQDQQYYKTILKG